MHVQALVAGQHAYQQHLHVKSALAIGQFERSIWKHSQQLSSFVAAALQPCRLKVCQLMSGWCLSVR
jgi:hypothetical protein